ncbi:hypothetical protein SAMN02745135_01400 [Caloranaerobacter azorensis DSM 13643]|uniref:Uncharacterized protein n=1 Tax=Caloranaerobacter azorensis DSM 13643 TaxID=1121264 RepID=A0A1M5UFC7_9FIRM|nr:hypothetical protein [Caloranaerobacter azorensis]SHH61734.1 hypothetical protein SAMN02745135_01400 [Caloranaerobacter azorensis DSM 13643]
MNNSEDIRLELLKDMENSIIKVFKINFSNDVINPMIEKSTVLEKNKKDNYLNLVKTALSNWKRAGLELTTYVYEHHGYSWGKKIKENHNIKSVEDIYKVLKDYDLNISLPGNYNIIYKDNDIVKFYIKKHVLIDTWKECRINYSLMYDLDRTWKEAFINGLNSDFKLQATAENIDGIDVFVYTIFEK